MAESSIRALPPASIGRPGYADGSRPVEGREPLVKPPDVIERMRRTCALAAGLLDELEAVVKAGVTTQYIDDFVHQFCLANNAYPSPLNYMGFPRSVCTSLNQVVCHGIPSGQRLRDGDIINVDVTLYREGVHGDTSRIFLVGDVDANSRDLVARAEAAMWAGIEVVHPGARLCEIGNAIEACVKGSGFSLVRDFCGHGIGTEFHGEPSVLHFANDGPGLLEAGMVLTVEPMVSMGSAGCRMWADGWTAVTRDGARSAQFEHTILITDTGYEVLTAGSNLQRDKA